MSINILRAGALGDVVMCSAVVAQFPDCHFYTGATSLAAYFDCPCTIHPVEEWAAREAGRDISLIGYPPDMRMSNHLIERFCEEAGVPTGEMKLKALPPLRERGYITLQRTSGWSEYKDYHHFDMVLAGLPVEVVELGEGRSWGETLSLIQHADGHLGIDSVCSVIAAAYKVPSVILYGSTSPISSGFKTALNLRIPDCEPCFIDTKYTNGHRYGDRCKCGVPCIDRLNPMEVVYAVGVMLNSCRGAPRTGRKAE